MKAKYLRNGVEIPANLKGVTVTDQHVIFDETWKESDIMSFRDFLGKKELIREIPNTKRKAYQPTEAETQIILDKMTGVENLDGFGIYEAVAAETLLDRHNEVLTKGFLQILADRYAEGRTVVDSHDSQHRLGKTFAAKVVKHPELEGESQLIVKFYVSPNAKMKSGATAVQEIDQGIVDRLSVAFSYRDYEYIAADDADNPYDHGYVKIDAPKKGKESYIEAYEISTVSMGAQAGARIKSAQTDPNTPPRTFGSKAEEMEFETLKITVRGQETEVKVATESAGTLKSIMDELKGFRDKQEASRKSLIDEYVKFRKAANENLDAEKEKGIAAQLPTEYLESQVAELSAKAAEKQLDPSKKTGEEDKTKQAKKPVAGGLVSQFITQ